MAPISTSSSASSTPAIDANSFAFTVMCLPSCALCRCALAIIHPDATVHSLDLPRKACRIPQWRGTEACTKAAPQASQATKVRRECDSHLGKLAGFFVQIAEVDERLRIPWAKFDCAADSCPARYRYPHRLPAARAGRGETGRARGAARDSAAPGTGSGRREVALREPIGSPARVTARSYGAPWPQVSAGPGSRSRQRPSISAAGTVRPISAASVGRMSTVSTGRTCSNPVMPGQ